MFGLMSPPPVKNLVIGEKKIPLGAAAAFIGDLYLNAKLELPNKDNFNPVDEVTKVVLALRKQGKKEVVNET